MLTTFRRLSDSWFFKGILLVTALSFMTFFGVGGLDEAARMSNSVITVGDVDVSASEFVDSYNKAKSKLEQTLRKSGAEMPDDKTIKDRVLAYVLSEEQSKATVKSAAKEMNVVVYPEKLIGYIRNVADFQDIEGNFDRNLFATFLNITGQSEESFMNELTDNIRENEITSPVAGLVYTPVAMVKDAYSKKYEERDVVVYDLPYDKVKISEKPSDDEIQSYYDSEKEDAYMNPEYRTLTVLYLPFEDVFASIPVSDEEITEAYELDKDAYVKPETRKIDQMRFSSEKAAEDALKALKKKDFRKVAKELLSQSENDTFLGDLPKSDVLAEAADELFSAKVGDVVGPVQSEFGWHLFKVLEITKGETTSVDDVKPAIVAALQKQKAADVLYEKAAAIDDFLGSGKPLEEAQAVFSLKSVVFQDIDVTGKDRKGEKIELPFTSADFLPVAFSLTEGIESPVTEADNAFYIVRADKITAPEVKPLEEVKDKVVALWYADKAKEKATSEAQEVLQSMQEGKEVKDTKTYAKVVKGASDNPFNESENDKIFKASLNEPLLMSSKDGIKVAMVTKIVPADPEKDKDGVAALNIQERQKLANEMAAALLSDFAGQYKVKINNALLKRLFGDKAEED